MPWAPIKQVVQYHYKLHIETYRFYMALKQAAASLPPRDRSWQPSRAVSDQSYLQAMKSVRIKSSEEQPKICFLCIYYWES